MRLACLALVTLLVGCGELDDIDAGVCGNGILEQGEDCDSSDPSCSPPGVELECRYVAVNGACPPGGAAVSKDVGGDEVCRFSTGEYQSSSFISAGANVLIGAADLDGDFALDPVTLQPGAVSVYFHDLEAKLVATASVPAPLAFPTLGSLNAISATAPGSGASAIVIADNGVDVVLGQTGRTLQSKAYAPYPLDESVVDVVFAEVNSAIESPGQEVLAFQPDGANTKISDIYLQRTAQKVLANVDATKLAEIAVGDVDKIVDKNGMDELLVAEIGRTELLLLKLWESPLDPVAKAKPIALPLGMKVASKPLLAQLNDDLYLDVMLRGCADLQAPDSCRLLVGHADGKGNFYAPETLAYNQLGVLFPVGAKLVNVNLPLAVGHLNADEIPDFVTAPFELGGAEKEVIPARVLMSAPNADTSLCYGWDAQFDNDQFGVPGHYCAAAGFWSQAIIGHLNGDGTPDVAATIGKSPIIEAMLGTGYGIFNIAEIGAQGEPTELLSGDFDGDLLPDLAFIEKGSEEETVAVAYGKPFGPPETPIRLSGLGRISHLRAGYVPGYPNLYDLVSDLAFLSRDVATKERKAALLYGSTDRFFKAPFYLFTGLAEQQVFHPAVRAIVGDFAADGEGTGHGDLAVISSGAAPAVSYSNLWLLPSTGDGELSNSAKKESDPLKDFFACGAAITPADLDGDGADQLVMLGLDSAGPALFVARQKPDAGFELGPRQPLQEAYMDLLGVLRCAGGGAPAAGAAGIDALAFLLLARPPRAVDISGETGADARPDIVAHVLPPDDDVPSPSTLKVSIFPNDGAGNLDPAKRVLLEMPPELSDRFVISFDFLNADSDPQKEIAFVTMTLEGDSEFSFGSAYLADIDLEQGKMILKGELPGAGKPVSVVTGDIDRDGVDDIVLSGLWGVEVLRGLPRAP